MCRDCVCLFAIVTDTLADTDNVHYIHRRSQLKLVKLTLGFTSVLVAALSQENKSCDVHMEVRQRQSLIVKSAAKLIIERDLWPNV